ncbi:PREDICTED: membrane steroid-binding protein 2-like [Camelina sativa]|uniref:Membrane steroid-binding protein 2-like n=1 Tax=Camelina sativa TaxID=90675 RepID=A0ABM0TH84_CAMSA|nr:PREDICTED: membrane steroid-binding protein 2-like [Camelina sativa]
MVLQVWETLKETITAYTGLSPAAFFTVLALAFAVYQVVSGFFVSDEVHRPRSLEVQPESDPLPPPVQLGEITEEDLKLYDGSDSKKPLLMAIKGQIYDVSQSRMFYGPGGPYALFAGKDASRALAKMSFEEQDLTGDISGLGAFELDALQDWEYKFMSKYVKVGTIQKKDEEGNKTSEAKATSAEGLSTDIGEEASETKAASPEGLSTNAEQEASAVTHDETSRGIDEKIAETTEKKDDHDVAKE